MADSLPGAAARSGPCASTRKTPSSACCGSAIACRVAARLSANTRRGASTNNHEAKGSALCRLSLACDREGSTHAVNIHGGCATRIAEEDRKRDGTTKSKHWMQIVHVPTPQCAKSRGSIMVRTPASHAEDPGSTPGRGVAFVRNALVYQNACVAPQRAPALATHGLKRFVLKST